MKRRHVIAAGATVLVAGGGAGWWRFQGSAPAPAPAAKTGLPSAAIVRADLIAREQIPGVLGYAAPWQLAHPGQPGVLTAVAAPGTIVQRGQMVYEVDGAPVVLLHGPRPVWREFALGMPPGADIRQLEENLTALGFGGSTVDDRFTATTQTAVRAWQRRQGRQVTGRLPLGSVVFAPGDARILEPLVPLGGRVGPEPVLRIASTTRAVTAALPLGRAAQVRAGDEVEVTVPGGRRVVGTITVIGALTEEPGGPNTIPMTVQLRDPSVAGDLAQVPVQVSIVVVERKGVLAVPVTALSAAGGGGYELIVVDGETRRPVPVRPGLIDERAGLVEVTGPGLAEGIRVEAPAP